MKVDQTKDTIFLFYPRPVPFEKARRIPTTLKALVRMLENDFRVIAFDEQIDGDFREMFDQNKDRLLAAGVSSMTGFQIKGAIDFSKYVKQNSSAPVVWGGWHTTLLPAQVLCEDYVDFIVLGQGEIPFPILLNKIKNGEKDFSSINSIGYKNNGQVKINSVLTFENPNNFPPVKYTDQDFEKYVFPSRISKRTFELFVSYGCPFKCGFCSIAVVFKRKWFPRNIDDIINELKYFKSKGIDAIKFTDDNLFVQRHFVLELCQRIIDEQLNITWTSTAHAGQFMKLFTAEDVKLIYKSGCRLIMVGVESGDQEVLDLIDKKTTVANNLALVKLLKENNIKNTISIIVGFPHNPDEDLDLSLKFVAKAVLADRDITTIMTTYTPYPGSELYDMSIKAGFVPPEKLEEWSFHILTESKVPWRSKRFLRKYRAFIHFYLPLMNPDMYKKVKGLKKIPVFIINKITYPLVYLRFRNGWFNLRIEAAIAFFLIRMVRLLTGKRVSLQNVNFYKT
jgi:radical SAM superfamily enzyme YgiQ (UPF0313 family)